MSYSDKRVQVPLEKGVPIDFEVMFRKSLDWKYEKEIRVMALLEHSKKMIGNGLWPICLFEVPHESVKEIVIGYKATDEVVAAVSDFSRIHGCKTYRATISETTFDMIREPIKHNNQVNKDASR